MAFTFDSTVKGASANSYVAVSSCNDYLTGRLDVSEWSAAATATQQYALAMATARLETESYNGTPTTSTQRLSWPRTGVPDQRYSGDPGGGAFIGYYGIPVYDPDTMPEPLIQACCELALMFLKDNTALADTGLESFERVSIGPIDVTPRQSHKAASLPAHVARLLRGLRLNGGAQQLVRG